MGSKVRKIGIDFGTSTSVICYQDYEKVNESVVPIGKCEVLRQGNTAAIPSAIVEVDEKMNIYKDCFGTQAIDAAGNPNVKLHTNFKMGLFNDTNKEQLDEDRRLTEKYFCFLKSLYDEANQLSSEAASEYEFITYVSFPVRAIFTEQDYVIEAAKKAGFINIQRMNEAEAALMYGFGRNNSVIRSYLKQYSIYDSMNVLLVDMGAGTTDITLYKYKCGTMNSELKELSSWPKPGQNKTLGGKEIDAFLLSYCKMNRLIDDMMCSSSAHDAVLLNDCKHWKENNISPALKMGGNVNVLGKLANKSYYAKNFYENNFLLNSIRFEVLIESYLKEFVLAIKDTLKRGKVEEKDLDFVICVGGSSQWYFVKDLFLSKSLASKITLPPLDCKKLKLEPNRCIAGQDPQLFVAKGLVIIPDAIEWKPISKHGIIMELNLRTKAASGTNSLNCSKTLSIHLLKQDDSLPLKVADLKNYVNFDMYITEIIVFHVTIYTVENEERKTLYTMDNYCPRTLSTTAKALRNKAYDLTSKFAGMFSSTAKDEITSRKPSDIINTSITIISSYSFNEAENLTLSLQLNSPTHWDTPMAISVR